MDPSAKLVLDGLLRTRRTGALGTLRDGGPFVSMVPVVPAPDGAAFYIHVSRLAGHTQDLLSDPRFSLMLASPDDSGDPQALARVSIQGEALEIEADSPEDAAARAAWLARFPKSGPILELGDFSFFALRPKSARFVGGFARAFTVGPEELKKCLAGP